MSGHTAYTSWFLWAYMGTFALFTGVAAWWLTDVVRRPADRFPGSWPAPRLRWGVVPAGWLLVIVLQTAIWLLGFAVKGAGTWVRAADIGLVTVVLLLAMIVAGLAYLLRVVFPSPGRSRVEPEDEGHEEGGAGP